MKESRYEKYVIRQPWTPPDIAAYKGTVPPIRFFQGEDGPVPEAQFLFEYSIIDKDVIMGNTPEKGPHKHKDVDEIFILLGTNPDDASDLGSEVDFWLGEGDAAEKISLTNSSAIYIPRGLLHMPIIFRNVKRPVIRVTCSSNVNKMSADRFPPRKL